MKDLLPAVQVGVGVLFVLLGIPLAKRRVPPNRWYGFRTPKTLSDPHIWYEANEYAGKLFARMGLFLMVTGAVLWQWRAQLSEQTLLTAFLASELVSVLVVLLLSFHRLGRLKDDEGE